METFFNLYLMSLLNIMTANANAKAQAEADEDEDADRTTGEKWSLGLAYIFFFLASTLVPILACVYLCKFSQMDGGTTYGVLLDGTKVKLKSKSRWLLVNPAFFFCRRIAFTLTVFLIRDNLIVQLGSHFGFSIAMTLNLLIVKPYATPFANRMEVFNECTIIMLSYWLLCFTDLVPDPWTQYIIGWPYVAVFLVNITVHTTLLTYSSGIQIRLRCRRRWV